MLRHRIDLNFELVGTTSISNSHANVVAFSWQFLKITLMFVVPRHLGNCAGVAVGGLHKNLHHPKGANGGPIGKQGGACSLRQVHVRRGVFEHEVDLGYVADRDA
jgi:hypothetical protein